MYTSALSYRFISKQKKITRLSDYQITRLTSNESSFQGLSNSLRFHYVLKWFIGKISHLKVRLFFHPCQPMKRMLSDKYQLRKSAIQKICLSADLQTCQKSANWEQSETKKKKKDWTNLLLPYLGKHQIGERLELLQVISGFASDGASVGRQQSPVVDKHVGDLILLQSRFHWRRQTLQGFRETIRLQLSGQLKGDTTYYFFLRREFSAKWLSNSKPPVNGGFKIFADKLAGASGL